MRRHRKKYEEREKEKKEGEGETVEDVKVINIRNQYTEAPKTVQFDDGWPVYDDPVSEF